MPSMEIYHGIAEYQMVINTKDNFNARFDATSREYLSMLYRESILFQINHGLLRNLI